MVDLDKKYENDLNFNLKYKVVEAIIFSSTTIANSAPTNNSTNLFSLHSGSKVEIVDAIGDWINIKIANGNNGWIKESDCKILQWLITRKNQSCDFFVYL